MNIPKHLEHLLPPNIRHIVALIGMPATMQLVRVLGGTSFPVALGLTRQGEIRFAALAEVVGEPAAEVLSKHFSGDRLYIAKCQPALLAIRNAEIRSTFDRLSGAGYSQPEAVAQLALQYKLCDRMIDKILVRPDPVTVSSQQDLF